MNKRQRQIVNRLDALVVPELEQARGQGYRGGRAPAGLSIRNASSDTAVLEIYGYIGGGGLFGPDGISAGDVSALLKDTTAPNLHVRINSGGGDYFQGVAIHTALRRHPATVTTSVDGMAASAASVIMLAGDVVEVAPGAMVMIHDAMTGPYGNAATLRREADLLDKVSEVIAELYADRAGEDAAHWRNLMTVNGEDGTWFTAEESVEIGLADRLAGDGENAAALVAARALLRKWESVLPENFREALVEGAPENEPEQEQEPESSPESPAPETESAGEVPESPAEIRDTPDHTPDVDDFAFRMRMWHWQQEMKAGRLAA